MALFLMGNTSNMKKLVTIVCSLIALSVTAQKAPATGKWIRLFNGKDLNNWTVKIAGHPAGENFGNTFSVENGVIKVSYDQYNNQFKEQFGHLFYKGTFSAYLLVAEYRFTGEQIKDGP